MIHSYKNPFFFCLISTFAPNSGYIARLSVFIRGKSFTNCDVRLSENNTKVRSRNPDHPEFLLR
ncbi:DUF6783 domain-containing protein [Robinsoniella peoriensis]